MPYSRQPTLQESISDLIRLTDWFATNPGFSELFCEELCEVEDRLLQRILETPARDVEDVKDKRALTHNKSVNETIDAIENVAATVAEDIGRLLARKAA